MKSAFGQIQLSDFWKGLFITVLTTLLTGAYNLLSAGTLPSWTQFQPYLISAIAAGVSYILKNLVSNSEGQILAKEPPPEKKVADVIAATNKSDASK